MKSSSPATFSPEEQRLIEIASQAPLTRCFVVMDTIAGYVWQVGAVAISRDGEMLASPSEDKTIKIWTL